MEPSVAISTVHCTTKLLKEKIRSEALIFLKDQQLKQEKIKHIEYKDLKMQDYLSEGDRKIAISKIIYKARGKIFDIKLQKRWKYDDLQCEGCQQNIESGEEILKCENLGSNEKGAEYDWFYSDLLTKQIDAGRVMLKNLNKRKQLRDAIT